MNLIELFNMLDYQFFYNDDSVYSVYSVYSV